MPPDPGGSAEPPEADLAEFARIVTGAHLETLGCGYRRTKRDEGGSAEPPSHLRYHVAEDGSIVGTFKLPPAEGMVFLTALDAERRRHFDPVPVSERPDLEQQAAVALVGMAEADLDSVDSTGSRFVLTIHSDGPTLQGEDTGRTPTIEDGPDIELDTALRLSCDCQVNRIVWGPDGVVLDHGHNQRTVTPPQKRALKARDTCCRFPGCGRTRHLKAHHITHWAHGGPSDMDNLVLLCSFHHHLVHEGGWDLRGNPNQALIFLDQDGRAVDPGSTATRGEPDQPTADNAGEGLTITPTTVESTWLGERCDYDTVIINLLAQERRAAAEHQATYAAAA